MARFDSTRSSRDFSEGDVFAVRLGAIDRWAAGVISRTSARWPNLILAHFFPHVPRQRPGDFRLPKMSVQDAVFVCRVSDLALRDGDWPVIGSLPDFSREFWPMPQFHTPDHRLGEQVRIDIYYEHDPGHLKRSTIAVAPTAARQLPDGATFGVGLAVERLVKILEPQALRIEGHETVRSDLVA